MKKISCSINRIKSTKIYAKALLFPIFKMNN